ncbi:MAG TPA: alpha/beta fold hydrolase [Methylomirabilota bacterium]|nr:alpha/beta fold hydrolase [Methylomirabilota bacterium]
MAPADRTVRVNGLGLHYVEWGRPDAPPVLLLHGITGHARVWDTLAGRLADRYRVLALDQRGHGDSDAPEDADYRVSTMAEDLEGFAKASGLGRFDLLGHSMGGRIAIAYAAEYVARLRRLVIVDIGPDINPAGLKRVRDMMANAPERIESEEWAYEYLRRVNPLYDPAELRHRIRHGLKPLANGGFAWKFSKGLRDMMREGSRDPIDLWPALSRIPRPILLVRGTESDILCPEVARRMIEAFPTGRLVEMPGAGHTVPGDKPEEFARIVRSFLDE